GPADIQTRKIRHLIRTHTEAEHVERGIDVPWHHTGIEQLVCLDLPGPKDTVAHEARADPYQGSDLADVLGQRHRGCHHIVCCVICTHDLQQLHDVGRREEMQTDHILGTFGD